MLRSVGIAAVPILQDVVEMVNMAILMLNVIIIVIFISLCSLWQFTKNGDILVFSILALLLWMNLV